MTYNNLRLSIIAILLLITFGLNAQKPMFHDQPDANYRQALNLYNNGQFGAAMQLFDRVIEQIDNPHDERSASSLFHSGICSAELQNPNAESKLVEFVERHSNHPGQNFARFHLGKIKYSERKFRDAENWLSVVDASQLDSKFHEELFFKRGHSHFNTKKYPEALRAFTRVSNPQSRFFAAANYYSGHIHYEQNNLTTALDLFNKLQNDSSFGNLVPYYISHIYYLQNQYDKLIEYATPLLRQTNNPRNSEIAKLVGDALFSKGQYQEAIPFFETFFSKEPSRISRDDRFQLGYAYYKVSNFTKAIEQFERLISGNDAMAQNAHYHLGAAYLETDQKRFARNAFLSAYQNNHNPAITQDALFNFAKLSHELSIDSYNEALTSFQGYIKQYPNSSRVNEAYQHLASIYLSTRNFRDALEYIEKTPINTPEMRKAYQRIAYYRGVELFNGGDFQGAIAMFDKSSTNPQVDSYLALATYWKGEAQYRQGKYNEAIATMGKFLTSPGAFSLKEFNRANYTIGYSHFKNKNFGAAIQAFRKFNGTATESPTLVNDANLRIGDSHFISKDYNNAIESYNLVIRNGGTGADYATLQKGLAQGATNQYTQKIATLQGLVTSFPKSSYVDNAKYEIGNSYLTLDNSQQAMSYFNQVIKQHPNSRFFKSAMLKSGLIHYNNNQDHQALSVFKEVVNKYPGSPESHEALNAMRNIYLNLNQIDKFVEFTSGLSFANISTAQQDSLMYMAAENRYMQNDCTSAVTGFESYLKRFPSGIFAINANFYLAECLFRAGNHDKALANYKFVATRPKSQFTENAVLRAALIEFNKNNNLASFQLYTQLEQVADSPENQIIAQQGQMRTLFGLKRYQDCINTVEKLLANQRVSAEARQEAHLLKGKSALEQNQHSTAQSSLQNVITISGNEKAAEAMYLLAYIQYLQRNYKKSEELIFEYSSKMSSHDYWLAKSYILLSDNYVAIDNLFQAKLTLQSIIDNYRGEDLRLVAREKLNAIVEKENQGQQKSSKPLEINLNPNRF
jgi:TolA-binding protein